MKNLIKASLLAIPFLVILYACSPDREEAQLMDSTSSIEGLQKKLHQEGKLLVPDARNSDVMNFDSNEEYLGFLQMLDNEDVNGLIEFTSQKVLEGKAKVDEDQEEMIKMMYGSDFFGESKNSFRNARGIDTTITNIETPPPPGPPTTDGPDGGGDADGESGGTIQGPMLANVTITASPLTTSVGVGLYAYGIGNPVPGQQRAFRPGTINGHKPGFYASQSYRNGFKIGPNKLFNVKMRVQLTTITGFLLLIDGNTSTKTAAFYAYTQGITPLMTVTILPETVRYHFSGNDLLFDFTMRWTIGVKGIANFATFNVPMRGWADAGEGTYKIWPLNNVGVLSKAIENFTKGK